MTIKGEGRKRKHRTNDPTGPPTKNRRVGSEQPSASQEQGDNDAVTDPADFMEIIREKTSESTSRNTRHIDFTLRFASNTSTAINPEQQLTEAFQRLFDRSFGGGREPPAGVIIQVYPPNWEKEFTIPLRPLIQNSPSAIAAALIKVNEEYNGGLDLFDGTSDVRIIAIWRLDPARRML